MFFLLGAAVLTQVVGQEPEKEPVRFLPRSEVVIELWPGEVPRDVSGEVPGGVSGVRAVKANPVVTDDKSNGVIRLTDVTRPVLEVFTPRKEDANGAAVVICPGGGYRILAVNLEGYEVAKWLNTLGYTAFVLHYRVPDNRMGALQDAQRALRVVRSRCSEWGVNPDKIGIMGFSAGASLSVRLSSRNADTLYSPVDAADGLSARPDFTLAIYPAYLDEGANQTVTPELLPLDKVPPMFLFSTHDDPYGNSALVMASALRKVRVPAELHYLPKGGHGYGVRLGNVAAETWPLLAEKWLAQIVPPVAGRLHVKRVVCVGNSITEGDWLSDRFAEAWPYVLQQKLGAPYKVLNYGRSGRTLLKAGGSSYWDTPALASALQAEPDVVIIKLGTNDSKPQYWSDTQTYLADFKALIDTFRNLPSHPRIYLCTPVPAFSAGWDIRAGVIAEQQVPALRKFALQEKAGLIDLYKAFLDKKALFPDGIHPNKEGAAQIAEIIAETLTAP